jgi:hypothetical protein
MLIYLLLWSYESSRDRAALIGWMLRRKPVRVRGNRVGMTGGAHIWCPPAGVTALDHEGFLASVPGTMP